MGNRPKWSYMPLVAWPLQRRTCFNMIRTLSIALTAALIAAGSAYVVFSGSNAIGEMQLRAEAGKVIVLRDGEAIQVEKDTSIQPGDFVTTDSEGAAILRLEGERRVQIAGGSRIAVTSVSSIESDAGDVLAEAGDSMKVIFGGVTASASDADFRVDLGFGSARAASYSGSVQLSSPGEARLTINRLHEATIAGADLPTSARPLRYDGSDAWDLALIKDVIDLDEDLETYGESLESQLTRGSARPSLGYFNGLAGRPVPFVAPYLNRGWTDLLIGFAVADNTAGSLERSFKKAFDLRNQGGRWGVVASIMRAKPKPLLASVQSLFVASGAVGGGRDGSQPEFTLAAAAELGGSEVAGTTLPGSGPFTDPGNDDDPVSQPPDGGNKPPEEPKKEEEPDDCSSGPECDINDIEDKLPVPGDPEPSPSPTDGPLTNGSLPSLGD